MLAKVLAKALAKRYSRNFGIVKKSAIGPFLLQTNLHFQFGKEAYMQNAHARNRDSILCG